MNTRNKKDEKKPRSQSIAKKLNASLNRKRLLRDFVTDILIAVLVVMCWCLTVESGAGGHITNVRNRGFFTADSYDFASDFSLFTGEIGEFFRSPVSYGESGNVPRILFSGVCYKFTVSDEPVIADASGILSAVIIGFCAVLLIQMISAVFRSVFGGGAIKKYLHPIDDIAMMAEQLSQDTDRHVIGEDEARTSYLPDETGSGDTADSDISPSAVENLAGVINKIDDSGTRIDVHQSELGGLEAAVNNMLKRLEEGKRRQIRFVDDASHELRTPISVIQGYVNMLDRWGKDDPKVLDEAISAIKNESEHMKTLIDQLLFLARGEMDRHVLDKKPIDARILIDETYEESVMIDKTHEYVVLPSSPGAAEEPDGAYTVLGDTAMLKQAIHILRDNAAKYTPPGGMIKFRVFVRSDAAGDKICIEVTDTGIGIPDKELSRIFDRFYRGTNARADNAGGSGLGLSIAKWITEEHGGTIEAISSTNIGTKMTIVLDRNAGDAET